MSRLVQFLYNLSYNAVLCLSLGMYTKDKKVELSVLVDRATGGGSIKDGELELMLHRFQIILQP